MKKFFKFSALFLVLTLFFTGCNSTKNEVYELVIMHTNDHHGAIETRSKLGGLNLRATYINSVRDSHKNVLLLDAGDINSGTAVSNMFKAEPDIRAYNMLKYDAVTFGNHEFDNDLALIEKQIDIADFPFLSANITRPDGSYLDKAYIVKNYKGFKVGVFGLTTLNTLISANPDPSLTFTDEVETAKKMVSLLRKKEKVDIVILLAHLGIIEQTPEQKSSIQVAEAVQGIDLIIDGHSHTQMDKPLIVNGTPIVSAWEGGKIVGTAYLTIQNKKITNMEWTPTQINTDSFESNSVMDELLKPYIDSATAELDKVVTQSTSEFNLGNRLSRYKEIALGDMVCDGIYWYVTKNFNQKVDFALINGGSVRASLPKGNITVRDITTVLPFDNVIFILSLKGSDVVKLFNFIGTIPQGAGSFPQVSKEVRYTVTYDKDGKNGAISDVTINGAPIDETRTYQFVTNDFLAGGSDGYDILNNSTVVLNTSCFLRDAIIEYIQHLPAPISPEMFEDGRIKVIGGVKTN